MPHASEILDGLSAIANHATGIAVTWHIVIAMALVALAAGWRPSERTALGLFYGLFGVLRLSMLLDIGLVGAAFALVLVALHPAGSGRAGLAGRPRARGQRVA